MCINYSLNREELLMIKLFFQGTIEKTIKNWDPRVKMWTGWKLQRKSCSLRCRNASGGFIFFKFLLSLFCFLYIKSNKNFFNYWIKFCFQIRWWIFLFYFFSAIKEEQLQLLIKKLLLFFLNLKHYFTDPP